MKISTSLCCAAFYHSADHYPFTLISHLRESHEDRHDDDHEESQDDNHADDHVYGHVDSHGDIWSVGHVVGHGDDDEVCHDDTVGNDLTRKEVNVECRQ